MSSNSDSSIPESSDIDSSNQQINQNGTNNVDSAVQTETEIYRNLEYDKASVESDDQQFSEKNSTTESVAERIVEFPKKKPIVKIKIITSEMLRKNKQAYEDWLKTIKEREKQKIIMERNKREEEEKARKEKQQKSQQSIQNWYKRKEQEELKKKQKMNKSKPASNSIVRGIPFEEWLRGKTEKAKTENPKFEKPKIPKQKDENHKKTDQKPKPNCKRCEICTKASYEKWLKSYGPKPKPVPLNRGFESLRGATTKIYMNPIPWKNLDD